MKKVLQGGVQFIDEILGQTFCAVICLAIEPRILHTYEIVLYTSLDKTPQLVDSFPGRPALYLFLRLCQNPACLELFLHLIDYAESEVSMPSLSS